MHYLKILSDCLAVRAKLRSRKFPSASTCLATFSSPSYLNITKDASSHGRFEHDLVQPVRELGALSPK